MDFNTQCGVSPRCLYELVGLRNNRMNTKQITILFKLEERWEFFRKLRGARWAGIVSDYEGFIRHHMAAEKCDVLPAALAVGKILSDAGKDPSELFAAAVEIVKREDGSLPNT